MNNKVKNISKCKWTIRPGINNSYWAFTPCNPGFNYISRVSRPEDIKPFYDNRRCPICGKPIECNIELIKDEIELSGKEEIYGIY